MTPRAAGWAAGISSAAHEAERQGHPAWRRIALGGGGGMFLGMGLGRFSYSAMVPALVSIGGLSPVEAGRVGMANLMAFTFGAFISVWLLKLVRRRVLLRCAAVLALLGLAGSIYPGGFLWLAACRGVAGVATGLIMVHSLALIAETAPAASRPVAASFVFAGVGLGILSSGVFVPMLLQFGLLEAWAGLALIGLAALLIAFWGWQPAPESTAGCEVGNRRPKQETAGCEVGNRRPKQETAGCEVGNQRPDRSIRGVALIGLVLAHVLFGFGIVPHTLYWVDFLARDLSLGIPTGGMHWSIVGLFAILGPPLLAVLARLVGTPVALVLSLLAVGAGIAMPHFWPATVLLVASSVLFGAQPGLSSLMAARARDLGRQSEMPRIMRAMILASSTGGFLGGLVFPWAYGVLGNASDLFLIGGLALGFAAVAALPGVPGVPVRAASRT